MILKTQRTKLKRLLKLNYCKEVKDILLKKGLFSEKGKPFSSSYITHVFNGKNENIEIEMAIIELYTKRKEVQSKMNILKKLL